MSTKSATEPAQLSSFLSADRPITSLEEDRLRRGVFARNLSKIFQEWKGRDSLVIALYGPWGTGKTSLKNLILGALENYPQSRGTTTQVLQFNPWQWAGHSDITNAFFDEVARTLGRTKGNENATRAANILRAYSAFLGASKAVLEGLPKLFANVLLLIGAIGFGASISQGLSQFGPIIGALLFGAMTIAGILGISQSVLEKLAARVSARMETDKRTLTEFKRDLSEALRTLDHNVLVVIDDIDRLTPAEIRVVFQLVKANADFPNFVYFLPFQRDVVAKALNDHTGNGGDQFLEKIVQIGFDIPGMSQADIDSILEEKLNDVFKNKLAANPSDKERWINLYQSGLRHYFSDLRRVNRFISSLAFHVELLKKNGLLEVNSIDLIAVETLRLFEPTVYHHLRASKNLLVASVSSASDDKKVTQQALEAIFVASDARQQVSTILKLLFPNRAWAFGGIDAESRFQEEWRAKLQICVMEFYDRYFQLTIPDTDILQSEALELVRLSDSPASFLDRLRDYARQDKLLAALDRLEANLDSLASDNGAPLLIALFDMGEELPDTEPGFFAIGPEWNIQRIVKKVLQKEASTNRRADIMSQAVRDSAGLSIPTLIVGRQQKMLKENNLDELLFVEPSVLHLRDQCVAKIRDFADRGILLHQREFVHILYRWAEWTTDEEVRTWTAKAITNPDGALAFLKCFVQPSVSSTGRGPALITWFIRLSGLEKFADLGVLEDHLLQSVVSSDDIKAQRALTAFREALARRAQGKDDDAF